MDSLSPFQLKTLRYIVKFNDTNGEPMWLGSTRTPTWHALRDAGLITISRHITPRARGGVEAFATPTDKGRRVLESAR